MLPRVVLLVALGALCAVPGTGSAQPPAKEPEVRTLGPAAPRPELEALKRAQFLAAHAHDPAPPSVPASAAKAPPLTTAHPWSETERAARKAWFAAHPAPTTSSRPSALVPRAWTPPASAKRPVLPPATVGPPDRAPLDAARQAKLARAQAPAAEK
jgi:hypothetical protein